MSIRDGAIIRALVLSGSTLLACVALGCLAHLRVKERWPYGLLAAPLVVAMVPVAAELNRPAYTGAMEAFGAVAQVGLAIPLAFALPVYAFLVRHARCPPLLKGAALLAAGLTAAAWGVSKSYGKNGFISDDFTGMLFVILVLALLVPAFGWLARGLRRDRRACAESARPGARAVRTPRTGLAPPRSARGDHP